jgi:ATPase subunit of ABC transporter with duplicated ATPase domains
MNGPPRADRMCILKQKSMLTLSSVSYALPTGRRLFENVTFTLNDNEKAALIGSNGTGKSSLFKIVTGEIRAGGSVSSNQKPYYVPQLFGQFDHQTIAQALRVDDKLHALKQILNGQATEHYLSLLDDDWSLEDRIAEALNYWRVPAYDLYTPLGKLSGGEKTKIFLAGIKIHHPALILLDEPTNHLDRDSRNALYRFVESSTASVLITSHDRSLLSLLNPILELSANGVVSYGGNFAFYSRQKQIEVEALKADLKGKEVALRKAREKERETLQRQQKLDARGKRKQEKAGLPTIVQNTLKNSAERSTAKIKEVHAGKIAGIASDLKTLRASLPDFSKMKMNIDPSRQHAGKVLFEAIGVNLQYHRQLWKVHLDLRICSGERWAVQGANGSGKSSLLRVILGHLEPGTGTVKRGDFSSLYVDQEYSLLNSELTVTEQAQTFNTLQLDEHEINVRLSRFLFTKEEWQKRCDLLSGGERMRLMLCCLSIAQASPGMIILDEPTNNLDIQSVDILTGAIRDYEGTLIVVSHDEHFLRDVNIQHRIELS